MKFMGVEVIFVNVGFGMFKDVVNEVMCDWLVNYDKVYYLLGIVVGLYLFLIIVCEYYCMIGEEICV